MSTDERMSYGLLKADGYVHGAVTHRENIYSAYGYGTKKMHTASHVWRF